MPGIQPGSEAGKGKRPTCCPVSLTLPGHFYAHHWLGFEWVRESVDSNKSIGLSGGEFGPVLGESINCLIDGGASLRGVDSWHAWLIRKEKGAYLNVLVRHAVTWAHISCQSRRLSWGHGTVNSRTEWIGIMHWTQPRASPLLSPACSCGGSYLLKLSLACYAERLVRAD